MHHKHSCPYNRFEPDSLDYEEKGAIREETCGHQGLATEHAVVTGNVTFMEGRRYYWEIQLLKNGDIMS